MFHRVGVVSYFIGDNLTELVSHYDIEAARGASAIFFVIALMVFQITPPLSHLIRKTHLTSLYKKNLHRANDTGAMLLIQSR